MERHTIRDLENVLCSSGLSRSQARRAIFHMKKVEGMLDALVPKEQPQKRGLLTKLKTALTGAK